MKRSKLWGVGVLAFAYILFGPTAHAEPASRSHDVVVTPRHGAPVRLHVTETGSGPPVVMLHGLGASAYAFRNLTPSLARTHRVIQLDLKGFGRSEKPFDDQYRPTDQAQLVAAFLRQQRLAGVTLLGHSFGGGVALLTTLLLQSEDPWRVKRLVLMSTPAYRQPLPRGQRLLTMPVVPYVALAVMPPLLSTRAALQTAIRVSPMPSENDAIAYAEPLYEAGGRHALIASTRAIAETDTRAFEPHYRHIRQPTLLVWCRQDPTVPLASGERLREAMPRARLVVLEHCGHMPHEEQPAETQQVIRRFLGGRD